MKTGLSNVGGEVWGRRAGWAGRQAGRQEEGREGGYEEEEEGGSAVTCLEYQSTEETKPFQEV